MINLSEEWKKAYTEYLEESTSDKEFDKLFTELKEAQDEYERSFNLLTEYYSVFAENEGILTEAGDAPVGSQIKTGDETASKATSESIRDLMKKTIEGLSKGEGNAAMLADYMPMASYSVEKISDMKFPGNLIFFLGQLIKWVRNVVIYFVEKIANMIRGLLGKQPVELDASKLDLKLERAKKIESNCTQVVGTRAFTGDLIKPLVYNGGNASRPVTFNVSESVEEDDFALALSEGLFTDLGRATGIIPDKKDKTDVESKPAAPQLVSIDLSGDIEKLRILVQHFYDVFDNAYGSNNEKLFGVEDLNLILGLFKRAISSLQNGDPIRYYSLNGKSTEIELVSADKIKDNLVVTNANLNNLKNAYVETAGQVADIAKVINSKEIIMLTDLGVDFSFLSSATYFGIKNILGTIKPRLKQAEKIKKSLEKSAREYRKLTEQLEKLRAEVSAVSNITYNTAFNSKVIDLLNASKYMSNIIILRLSALGLYIKELKDVRDVLAVLANGVKPKDKGFKFGK